MEPIHRETGHFPLSIGTSLAIEGLLGQHPDNPPKPRAYRGATQLWINLRTLIRNYFAAMTADDLHRATTDVNIDLLLTEVTTIPTLLEQHQNGQCQAVFYVVDLAETKWAFPGGLYKEPKTPKQVKRAQLEHLTLILLLQQLDENRLPYTQVGTYPKVQPGVIALLTHFPHELLWRFMFSELYLLESHTGKLKSATQWLTKLKGVGEDDHLPFNAFTLQLFGDGVLFNAHPKALRDEVKQLATTRKWTGVTTLVKIRQDINRYASTALKEVFSELTRRE